MRYLSFAIVLALAPPYLIGNDDEALFVRRVQGFLDDHEYVYAKGQIEDFLLQFPQSGYADFFRVQLGHIALEEENYEMARQHFEALSSPLLALQVRLKRVYCLYKLKKYELLRTQLPAILKENLSAEERDAYHFYYAEALFREAAGFYAQGEENLVLAKDYCKEAIPHYESLTLGVFAPHAQMALAEIYRLLGDYEKAASLYLELTTLSAYDKPLCESLLLHAAKMLAKFDKGKAKEIYLHIVRYGKSRQEEAASCLLNHLFENRNWDELISLQEEIFGKLTFKEKGRLHYALGIAQSELGNKQNAVAHLETLLAIEPALLECQSALLALLNLYKDAGSLEKLEACFGKLMRDYGNDTRFFAERAQGELLRALALKEGKKWEASHKALDQIIEKYKESTIPEIKDLAERALFEKCRLYYEQKKWDLVQNIASMHPLYFPGEEKRGAFAKITLQALLKQIDALQRKGSVTEVRPLYSKLKEELEKVEGLSALFAQDAREEMRVLKAKACYALGKTEEAIAILQDSLTEKLIKTRQGEIHFLLALSYVKEENREQVLYHGEKALENGTSSLTPQELRTLHLSLFNAYTQNRQKADHLFEAISLFPKEESLQPVSLENLIWLAHYYKQEYLDQDPFENPAEREILKRKALFTFEHLLGLDNGFLPCTEKLLKLEAQVVKLADFYSLINQKERGKKLIEELLCKQAEHSNWAWQCAAQAELFLADLYLERGDIDKAAEIYQKVEKREESSKEAIYKAKLMAARLAFAALPTEKRKEDAPEILPLLQKLKDLMLNKCVAYEPIHLEAAIDYAEFSAALLPDDLKDSAHLELLKKVRREFTSKEDIFSKEYHASFVNFPEKESVFECYIRYIDGKILLLEGEIAKREGNFSLARSKMGAAHALFSTLRQSGIPYLLCKVD